MGVGEQSPSRFGRVDGTATADGDKAITIVHLGLLFGLENDVKGGIWDHLIVNGEGNMSLVKGFRERVNEPEFGHGRISDD